MSQSKTTSLIAALMLSLGGTACAGAATPGEDFPDRIYLTLAPEALPADNAAASLVRDASLPILTDKAYNDAVFAMLLKVAAEVGQDLSETDPALFDTWLLGALTVMSHESRWTHFRRLDPLGGRCQTELNSGKRYSERSTKLEAMFEAHLRPLVQACPLFDAGAPATQLLASYDLESVGIMQLALRWHLAEYTEPRAFLSVEESLRYGLGYLYKGFISLARNSEGYECLRSHRPESKEFRRALVRGAWAGQYNSGQLGRSCRFADPSDPWAANDLSFERDLERVLAADDESPELSPSLAALRLTIARRFESGSRHGEASLLQAIQKL